MLRLSSENDISHATPAQPVTVRDAISLLALREKTLGRNLNDARYLRRLRPNFEREWEEGICGRDEPAGKFPPPDGGRECDWDLNFPDFCCGGRD